MTFLPENYEQPASWGNYLKFKKGTTRFRIMSDSITGYLDWKDNKPVRTKEKQSAIDPERKPKHFWAFVVWDCDEKRLKILEVTQKGIQDAILALYKDQDRGDPKGYDIKVTKEGEGMDTKYAVAPWKLELASDEATKAYKDASIYLEALYDGEDPFTADTPFWF